MVKCSPVFYKEDPFDVESAYLVYFFVLSSTYTRTNLQPVVGGL